jgi:S-DNA-T family DNA segregation ATPase FtsK/SpoIIIE
MRKVITGEQVAQLYNRDPFALPAWRAPIYQTPAGFILLVQLFRLLAWIVRLVARHPLAATVLAVLAFTWVNVGWLGLVVLAVWVLTVLGTWRFFWPGTFTRWIAGPARGRWRTWFYRRRWAGVMAISGVAPWHQGRIILPVLGKVQATRYTDRVAVRLVSGQSPADLAKRAEALAHGFGALLCRVRSARSGQVVLEFVRRDALAAILPALPIPDRPDLKALPVGRREDGLPWLARVLAADPKLMELAYARVIFDTYGAYAADPVSVAVMLDQAVADMQDRAARFDGVQRDHTPTAGDPFTVVLVDEVAFLTAYQPDRKLRERIMNALATLTTQGRAVGYCVVAALQDPRKDVLTIRNLFPDRIAMRLDEPEQVDMVLGDGAYDRGAACELISSDPPTGAGVAYVRLESDPDPVRVRAGWVTDADIRALAGGCIPDRVEWPEVAA